MIEECKDGKIDMVVTKSISRFARNTLDCLEEDVFARIEKFDESEFFRLSGLNLNRL